MHTLIMPLSSESLGSYWTTDRIEPIWTEAVQDFFENRYGEESLSSNNNPALSDLYIRSILSKRLTQYIRVVISEDGDSFLAEVEGTPFYGFGATPRKAFYMVRREIESIYAELEKDDDFSDDWLALRKFFEEIMLDDE